MNKNYWKFPVLFLMITNFLLPAFVKANEMIEFKKIIDVPAEKWEQLANKRIYFGHQSVGFNIIDGIEKVLTLYPKIKLSIVETRKNDLIDKGIFAHFRAGKNREPATKIDDFVNVIDTELNRVPDIAFLKFCYVDIPDKVAVDKLFQLYKEKIGALKKNNPNLLIIHFTMPLKTQHFSWKTKFKNFIGKESWELAENIKRNNYNKLLLKAYNGNQPIFDIASYQATLQDGSQTTFKYKGEKFIYMQDSYSSDGGHLNAIGAKVIAEQLLIFLAENS
jgi:hypothetical protein